MKVDTSHILPLIEALETKIKASKTSEVDSFVALGIVSKMALDSPEAFKDNSDLFETAQTALDMLQIQEYEETLAMNLMEVKTKYVVTNTERLMSPAGFATNSRVFKQTPIAIHTNSIENIPYSNKKLYAHLIK